MSTDAVVMGRGGDGRREERVAAMDRREVHEWIEVGRRGEG